MLTKDEAMTVLARIIAENTDNVNPTGVASCVYWDEKSEGIIRRCIVGQMAHELGWPEPSPEDGSVVDMCEELMPWSGLADAECQQYLGDIQLYADGIGTPSDEPIRWGDIKL